MMTLGSTIRQLRLAAGLSQRSLAERLDVNPSYLSHLEADRREPSLDLLRRLSSELSVPAGLMLAVALWTDLADTERERFRPIISKLVDIGTAARFHMNE